MKKILIMGLGNISNYGDNFIIENVKYLVESIIANRVVTVDFEPEIYSNKFLYYLILCTAKICPIKNISSRLINFAVKVRCKKIYEKKIKDVDALIFACGSLKYGTQKLWAYYSLAIECAEKRNIPVMFNAMNIQRYDRKDWRCKHLNKHLQSRCVKMITCRDGEEGVRRLKNEYSLRSSIISKAVGDSAFWMREAYNIKQLGGREVIGINLIEGNTFIRYGNTLKEKEVMDIYLGVLNGLDKEGIKWELFTNGLEIDYRFGEKLLKQYGQKNIKIRVPNSDRELIEIIGSYQMILGARLHANICAYALDIPFIGFIWDEKILDFSKMSCIESLFIEEKDFSSKEVLKRIEKFQSGLNEEQKLIREKWKKKTKNCLEEFIVKNI